MALAGSGSRSVGRQCALMILFALEAEPADPAVATKTFFLHLAPGSEISADEEARAYAQEICVGVMGRLAEIDQVIQRGSAHWRIERMPRVDRNVLRLATWELLTGIPRAVAIDEAVSLGKRFGAENTGAFVNGVLSKVADLVLQG